MPENHESDDDRAARLDQALAESQRQEREERDAELARQAERDQALSEALAHARDDDPQPG